jgi:hypothetical protein
MTIDLYQMEKAWQEENGAVARKYYYSMLGTPLLRLMMRRKQEVGDTDVCLSYLITTEDQQFKNKLQEVRNMQIVQLLEKLKVPYRSTGKEYVCNCPVHKEKTPSCYISKSKNLYHCFGCGAKGDVINLYMRYADCTFKDAVEFLSRV